MDAKTTLASRLIFLLGFVCCATSATAQGLPPVGSITGTLFELESFNGPVSGVAVDYAIYLPPGYEAGSQSYPVIYHLHGFSGRVTTHEFEPWIPPQFRCPETSCHILPAVDAAIVSGDLPPLIMVFPKMGLGEMWAESLTGDRPTESKFIGDLIPYIDSHYRTIPDRRFRLIQGWSQGGWGAGIYGLKYPDLFGAILNFEGAYSWSWERLTGCTETQTTLECLILNWVAAYTYGGSEDYFDLYNAFALADEYPSLAAESPTEVLTVVGNVPQTSIEAVERNLLFRDQLDATGIPNQFLTTFCPHSLLCNYQLGGTEVFEFVRNNIEIADIDMNPGSERNTVNLKSKGVIPVAILTDDYFNAVTQIDPSPAAIRSFSFGPDSATPAHRGHTGDVDGDGDLDVVLHFRMQDTGIRSGDVQACLSGTTITGAPIRACEVIVTK